MVKGYAYWLLVLIGSAVDLPLLYSLSEPACMSGPSPLQMALKCSDLGHLCAPRDVHIQWVNRLEEEVRCQLGGDKVRIHVRNTGTGSGNMQVDKEHRFQGRHECCWLDGPATPLRCLARIPLHCCVCPDGPLVCTVLPSG